MEFSSSTFSSDFIQPVTPLITEQRQVTLYPTLFIGLGPTGEACLRFLKKLLLDRGEGNFPYGIQLNWIGVQSLVEPLPGMVELTPSERISINPKYEQILSILNSPSGRYPYLSWWKPAHRPGVTSRADGRMALYWLLDFENQAQKLKNLLASASQVLLSPPENRFRVFFLASASETDSAMLPDLAFILRSYSPNRIKQMAAWMIMPPFDRRDDTDTLRGNQVAALRELERFMSGQEQILDLGPQFPRSVTNPKLFDHVFLLDDPDSAQNLSNLLLTTLEPGVGARFSEMMIGSEYSQSQELVPFVNAVAGFTYVWPKQEICNVSAAHLAADLLFGSGDTSNRIGLFPLRAPRRDTTPTTDFKAIARKFLRDDENLFAELTNPFLTISEASEQRWNRLYHQEIREPLADTFRDRLGYFLNKTMNDRRKPELAQERLGVIGWTRAFLNALNSVLSDASIKLLGEQNNPQNGRLARLLNAQISGLRNITQQFISQVESWEKALSSMAEIVTKRYQDRLSLCKISAQPSKSRRTLLAAKSLRNTANSIEATTAYYDEYINSAPGSDAWGTICNRLAWVWDWSADGNPRLRWLVLSIDQSKQEWRQALYSNTKHDLHKIADTLENICLYFTRHIAEQKSVMGILDDFDSKEIVEPLRNPDFLLRLLLRPDPARRRVNFVAAPDTAQFAEWAHTNALYELAHSLVQSTDRTRLSFLAVEQNLPLSASVRYSDAERYYGRDPSLYAFPQEQNAVTQEKRFQRTGQHFDPRFTRLMIDSQDFETAMQCAFFIWIKKIYYKNQDNWYIYPTWGEIPPVPLFEAGMEQPVDLESALAMMLIKLPRQTQNNAHPLYNGGVDRFHATLASLKSIASQFYSQPLIDQQKTIELAGRQIKDWKDSNDRFLTSLALYQENLLKQYQD